MRVGMETFIARAADTGRRRPGRSLASVGSSSDCKRGKIEDVDNSRVRPVCGQFLSAADACSRTVETGTCSRMRPGCDGACVGGLSADMDCSWTRTNRVRGLFPTGPRSWTCQCSGHGTLIPRGHSACPPRPIRGRRILVKTRGKAYIKLNTLRNTLPALLPQLVSPAFQLRHYGLEASDLLDCL